MPPAPANQDFQYTIDIQSRLDDPGQFADIVVKGQTAQGGRLVRVKDVARIELGSQTYSQQCLLDGRPAAGIAIYQAPDANSLQVGKEVGGKKWTSSPSGFQKTSASAFPMTPRCSSKRRSRKSIRRFMKRAFLSLW